MVDYNDFYEKQNALTSFGLIFAVTYNVWHTYECNTVADYENNEGTTKLFPDL